MGQVFPTRRRGRRYHHAPLSSKYSCRRTNRRIYNHLSGGTFHSICWWWRVAEVEAGLQDSSPFRQMVSSAFSSLYPVREIRYKLRDREYITNVDEASIDS